MPNPPTYEELERHKQRFLRQSQIYQSLYRQKYTELKRLASMDRAACKAIKSIGRKQAQMREEANAKQQS